jgi:flagellar hook-length control protein FliK
METIALNLPLSNLATPGTIAAEGALAQAAEEDGAIDFATLLAAGLEIAQAGAQGALTLERTEESLPRAGGEVMRPEPVADALAILPQTALPQAMPQSPVADAAVSADAGRAARDLVLDARQSSSVAAEAANLAASSAAEQEALIVADAPAARADTTAGEFAAIREIALRDLQAPDGNRHVSSAEAALSSLNLPQATERPGQTQATALLEVGAPVSGPGFADALSRQVVWMVDKDAQVAELRINPPELGPVEVRLTLSGDEASAQFVSAHAEVRNAIESAISRLREAMAEAGIQLGETTVSAESFREQASADESRRDASSGYRNGGDAGVAIGAAERPRASPARGLIDVFA